METLLEIYDELCDKASLGQDIVIPQRLKSEAEDISVFQLKRRARALETNMEHIPGSKKDQAIQDKITDLALIAYYIFHQRFYDESEEPEIA